MFLLSLKKKFFLNTSDQAIMQIYYYLFQSVLFLIISPYYLKCVKWLF